MEDTFDPLDTEQGLPETEKSPSYDIPFLQSSQTVRRSTVTKNHLNSEDEPNDMGSRRSGHALDLDKLLADQEYKYRQHLTTDQNSQVDKRLGLRKGRTASRYIDDQLTDAGQQSSQKLPKLSELSSRSRKRTNKQRSALSKNAMAVAEHVTQLQRKKTNFYGAPVQRNEEPFSPPDVRVQVTREQLQQVPSSSDIVQHSCGLTTFWSSNDWLFSPRLTNNLSEEPKASTPQGLSAKTANYPVSDGHRLGSPSILFEECERAHEDFHGKDSLDMLHLKSNAKKGQFYPEE